MPDAITIGRSKYNLQEGKQLNRLLLRLYQLLKTKLIGMADNHLLVKYHIRSCLDEQYCPRPEAGRQLFSDLTQQRNNLYRKKTPPQQYQQQFRNLFLQEEGSDAVYLIFAPSTTQLILQQFLLTIVNQSTFSTFLVTYPVVSYC